MMEREPTPAMVRERLHLAHTYQTEMAFIYLSGCRVSEACGTYAVEAQDVNVEDFEGWEFLVIKLKTAKREGLVRSVASSLAHDPLAEMVWDGLQEKLAFNGPLFEMTDRTIRRATRATFYGLSYPIMKYSVTEEDEAGARQKKKVGGHSRDFSVHALRHLRTTELSQHYGLTGEDLARFNGWTMGSAGLSNMVERYEMFNWRKYGQKLLQRPPWVPGGWRPISRPDSGEDRQDKAEKDGPPQDSQDRQGPGVDGQ